MHRCRGWPLLFALLAAVALAAPLASAFQATEVSLRFEDARSYELLGEVVFTEEDATTYRNGTDLDGNGTITTEEVQAVLHVLARTIADRNRSDHRLDGERPASVQVEGIWATGLVGPANATGPVELTFEVGYAYAVNESANHTLALDRDPTAPNARFAVTVVGPEGWAITNTTGMDDPSANLTFAYDPDTRRSTLTAEPGAAYGLTLERLHAGPVTATDGNGSIEDEGEATNGSGAAPGEGSPEQDAAAAGTNGPTGDRGPGDQARQEGASADENASREAGSAGSRGIPAPGFPLAFAALALAAGKLQKGKQPPSC